MSLCVHQTPVLEMILLGWRFLAPEPRVTSEEVLVFVFSIVLRVILDDFSIIQSLKQECQFLSTS